MSRNLIIYKVQYVLKSDPWKWGSANNKFVKIKRIVMTPEEVDQTDGYWRNHRNVENKFFKQMEGLDDTTYSGNKYRIKSVRKA
jgi:hypothetical protein